MEECQESLTFWQEQCLSMLRLFWQIVRSVFPTQPKPSTIRICSSVEKRFHYTQVTAHGRGCGVDGVSKLADRFIHLSAVIQQQLDSVEKAKMASQLKQ